MMPPITYYGGKARLAPLIADLLPAHGHYVEPFAGSLSVLLAKRPSDHETVNDLDGELVNFWRVLRDHLPELELRCALTPHSRADLEAADNETRAAVRAADPVEGARLTWLRLTQGRSATLRHNATGWRFYASAGGTASSMPDYLNGYLGRFGPAAARLRAVSLECRTAAEVIGNYDRPGILMYCDPPYLASVRGYGNHYTYEMRTDAEHTGLAGLLNGCRCAVVVSGYPSPLYDALYAGWHTRDLAAQSGRGQAPGTDVNRTERLWSNRPFPHEQTALFGE